VEAVSKPAKLGIIAGRGDLPVRLVEAARAAGREVYVLAIKNQVEQSLDGIPHDWIRLGAAGKALDLLRANGVVDLVFAGAVKRPSIAGMMPDARMARFLAKVAGRALGDDGVLRAIVAEFEAEGFHVVGADDVLRGLVMARGQLGRHTPDDDAWSDIRRGIEIARAIGALDIGQSVVVQQGKVLGVEGVEGTDALIERCAGLRREGPGGVLVKAMKPNQDRRVDLPTVGPETVARAAASGLRGIAVEADNALMIDRSLVVAEADRLGLFLVGFTSEPESGGSESRNPKVGA
jgi:DUF1009 family protein